MESMLTRLRNAETADEVVALAAEAVNYKFASEKTKRRWAKAIKAKQ